MRGGKYNYENFSYELPSVTISCEESRNLTREKVIDFVPPPQAEIQDLDQVKLTLDLSRMVVIEERYSPSTVSTKLSGEVYQCQSLGVTVPEIDTSQSLTPIGRDL